MIQWLDKYFFKPNFWQKILIFLLLPFSYIYALIAIVNTKIRSKISFDIPIISIGNLTLGGNGKTPICKAIAKIFENKKTFIILRGYKRKGKDLKIIKSNNQIFYNVDESGDEAMEYALNPYIYGVIVSIDRTRAIKLAIEQNAELVLLDDAFSKFHINKFDILLESAQKPYYDFTLPSGMYRLPLYYRSKANYIAIENIDFIRHSKVKYTKNTILISSIAKPFRLSKYLNKVKAYYFFSDHYKFTKNQLQKLLLKHNCDTFMLTLKDYVKIKDFGFKINIIELDIELKEKFKNTIKSYVEKFDEPSKY